MTKRLELSEKDFKVVVTKKCFNEQLQTYHEHTHTQRNSQQRNICSKVELKGNFRSEK